MLPRFGRIQTDLPDLFLDSPTPGRMLSARTLPYPAVCENSVLVFALDLRISVTALALAACQT